MKVRATQMGYYGNVIRVEGDEFEITSADHLGSWMEPLEPLTEEVEAPVKAKGSRASKSEAPTEVM